MPAVTPGEAKASVSPGKGSKKEVITRRDPHALAKRNFEKNPQNRQRRLLRKIFLNLSTRSTHYRPNFAHG